MNLPERSITILIAALGGEGGGVMAEWVVEAATKSGLPVQATSIPGVAQRTGATTYYLEIFPAQRAALGGREPVMSRPLKLIRPRVGARKCVSRLKHVVFPAPLGPMRAWMLPRRTLRLTSLTATKPRNSLVKPSVSRITSVGMLPDHSDGGARAQASMMPP